MKFIPKFSDEQRRNLESTFHALVFVIATVSLISATVFLGYYARGVDLDKVAYDEGFRRGKLEGLCFRSGCKDCEDDGSTTEAR